MTAGASNVNFDKAVVNLSAPASGNTAGVLFYRDPAQNSAVNFNKCTCSLSGLVYFPTASVNYNTSAGGSYAVLVFGSGNFNGADSTFSGAPANASLIDNVVLVQ